MSVAIDIRNAVKMYGSNTVIDNLNLSVREGEFFTLLGPSGCGKTTLLRMIAGFNSIEGGDFLFNGLRINDLDPAKRKIGMVFQNYAIFPHMTVRKNVAFGLENMNVPKAERNRRVAEYLELMQIDQFADRMPERLSGGQQQRVALARALVISPDVLLMDEPLSNLDAKLRVEMRSVIRRIQQNIGITTVYVTHDQEEAMAVSDRIAVMNGGVIQQIGAPKAIYQRPANTFVANFIGQSFLLKGALYMDGNTPVVTLCGGYEARMPNIREDARKDAEVLVAVRPEEFCITSDTQNSIPAQVIGSVFLGLNTHYFVRLADGTEVELIQESEISEIIQTGTAIHLRLKEEKINVFSGDGQVNLLDDAGAKEG